VWKQPSDEPDTYALLVQAVARLARDGRRLCVVLDRFEEFVILLEPEARAGFAALLRQLAEEPVSGLRLVLVLRTEYEHLLADAGLPRLRQGENWFKLGAFTEPAAREFLKGSGLDLAPETFDRLLKGAAALETTRGLYRPIVLNHLGLILARPAVRLHEGFDPERAIQTHLRESVGRRRLARGRGRDPAADDHRGRDQAPVEETTLATEARRPFPLVRHCLLRLRRPASSARSGASKLSGRSARLHRNPDCPAPRPPPWSRSGGGCPLRRARVGDGDGSERLCSSALGGRNAVSNQRSPR
jgi:hypothetical protein